MSPRMDRHATRLRVTIITAVTLGMLVMSFSLAAFAASHASGVRASRPIAAADMAPSGNGHAAPWMSRGHSHGHVHPAVSCRPHDLLFAGSVRPLVGMPRATQHVCRLDPFK